MAATLGLTRYGISVEFSDTTEGEKTSKTYNGIDFTSNNATALASKATVFVRGGTYDGATYTGLAGLLAENFIVNSIDLIARNQVNGTVGD